MSFTPSEAPPPYDFKDAPVDEQRPTQIPTDQSRFSPEPQPQLQLQPQLQFPVSNLPFYALLRSHQAIGIYCTGISDLYLAQGSASPPLCHVTTHRLRSPSLSLHQTGSPQSAVIATAQYSPFSSNIELQVAPATEGSKPVIEKMHSISIFGYAWGFAVSLPGVTRAKERFEWKASRGPDVRNLDGRSKGLKLVRVSTGEVVAAYARSSMSLNKLGKFRWVLNRDWGEEFDILVVMGAVAVMEKLRRLEQDG